MTSLLYLAFTMLTEDDVVDAVCRDLKARGYETGSRTTKQRGIDITAIKGSRSLLIEAKGATSNRRTSKRYGKPFTRNQCSTHVGMAFFTAASLTSVKQKKGRRLVAIALPDNEHHRDQVKKVAHALDGLGIGRIWVSASRTVRYEGLKDA